jgi:hypothetical protein
MPLRGRWLVWLLDVDASQGCVVSIAVAGMVGFLGPPGSNWLWVTLESPGTVSLGTRPSARPLTARARARTRRVVVGMAFEEEALW